MVSIDSITDTSRGIVKLTGPCSMSSPCPGITCPEHGLSQTQVHLVSDAITRRYAELQAERQVYLDRAARHETCGRHEDYRAHCLQQADQLEATLATLNNAHEVLYFGMGVLL